MKRLSSLIRSDKEFSASIVTLKEQFSLRSPKPLIINGLSTGASFAYLAEAIGELRLTSSAPTLVIVGNDTERERCVAALSSMGVRALGYKPRDFVFHNISASHDTERERLSVLLSVMHGDCDAVVTTPSAALSGTVPEEILMSFSAKLSVGDEISPESLSEKLVALGFARVELVESAGQFSRRGGILDVWAEADQNPVRLEFFGDEIDRIAYFDPIIQRSLEPAESLDLMPACEVLVDNKARERILAANASLLKKARSEEIFAKLSAERAALESNLPLNFRDKYLGLVYEEFSTLLSYFSTYGRA